MFAITIADELKEKCPKLWNELNILEWKDNGVDIDDKGGKYGHITDAFSYFAYNYKTLNNQLLTIEM